MFILLPSSLLWLIRIQACVCIRLSTLINRNYREFDPGRDAASTLGIPGLGYRYKPVLGSAFGCNPLRTAAANGKRIHISANQEPPETSKFDLSNGNQRQQESFRVTVGLYKLEVTLLIVLDWINYEHSFVSLSLKNLFRVYLFAYRFSQPWAALYSIIHSTNIILDCSKCTILFSTIIILYYVTYIFLYNIIHILYITNFSSHSAVKSIRATTT